LHEDEYTQGDRGGAKGGVFLHHRHQDDKRDDEDGDDQRADDVGHHADEIVAEESAQGDLDDYQDQRISGYAP